jgi:hypothetical protein
VLRSKNASKSLFRTRFGLCALALTVCSTGCQNGPILGRMKQSQIENERLLSEFRSQKKEVEQLRADRTRLLQQQAETEKLAAKLKAQLDSRGEANSPSSMIAGRRDSFSQPARVAQDTRDRTGRPSTDRNSNFSSGPAEPVWRPIRKNGQ